MEFLMQYITVPNVIVVAVVVALLGFLWYKGQKKEVLQVIEYLVDMAEQKFGSGTGPYKYAFVMTYLYPKLPILIRTIVSPETMDAWIEREVDRLQAKLKKIEEAQAE